MGFALYDRSGQFKQLATDSVLVSTEDLYVPEMTCNITCRIEDGDRLLISKRLDGQWMPVPQSSNAYMVFHPGQKISELVSLAYGLANSDVVFAETDPFFSICGVKEVYWEVWSEDLGVRLATSKSEYEDVEYGDDNYVHWTNWDRETDEYRSIFYYPAGNYRILLRNFDEELTLYVKL